MVGAVSGPRGALLAPRRRMPQDAWAFVALPFGVPHHGRDTRNTRFPRRNRHFPFRRSEIPLRNCANESPISTIASPNSAIEVLPPPLARPNCAIAGANSAIASLNSAVPTPNSAIAPLNSARAHFNCAIAGLNSAIPSLKVSIARRKIPQCLAPADVATSSVQASSRMAILNQNPDQEPSVTVVTLRRWPVELAKGLLNSLSVPLIEASQIANGLRPVGNTSTTSQDALSLLG